MDKDDKYVVKLSETDIYWLRFLLKGFIEGEANITQIQDTLPLFNKLGVSKKKESEAKTNE